MKEDIIIKKEFINYSFDEANLVRLNRVRNYTTVLYISNITEGNRSIFNRKCDQSTKSEYNLRQEVPYFFNKIWKYAQL